MVVIGYLAVVGVIALIYTPNSRALTRSTAAKRTPQFTETAHMYPCDSTSSAPPKAASAVLRPLLPQQSFEGVISRL